jgi:hypothetical protein
MKASGVLTTIIVTCAFLTVLVVAILVLRLFI